MRRRWTARAARDIDAASSAVRCALSPRHDASLARESPAAVDERSDPIPYDTLSLMRSPDVREC